jgi:mono/diheme cytochrome c family protein
MAATARNTTARKLIFLGLLAAIVVALVFATSESRQWKIPEEAKQKKNPLQPSPAALHAARDLYLENCANCHGDKGRGDGPESKMHDPLPADLSNYEFNSKLTDGEIFYQISEGRKPMPAYKRRLTEEQRWELVMLVRAFAGKSEAKK